MNQFSDPEATDRSSGRPGVGRHGCATASMSTGLPHSPATECPVMEEREHPVWGPLGTETQAPPVPCESGDVRGSGGHLPGHSVRNWVNTLGKPRVLTLVPGGEGRRAAPALCKAVTRRRYHLQGMAETCATLEDLESAAGGPVSPFEPTGLVPTKAGLAAANSGASGPSCS